MAEPQNKNQVSTITPIDALKKDIRSMEPQFKAALPAHISAEKFTRVAITALSTSPGLASCERNSLFAACMRAAQEGLLPDGREAAIISFSNKATFIPMVSGILKKVRNSGELSSITAQILFEKDKFKYWVDSDGEHLEHEPNLFSDRGSEIGVYALAKTKDGGVYIEVMTNQQIEQIRQSSKSKDSGPWKQWAGEMAKKTVIKRLSKRLPMSTDLDNLLRVEDEADVIGELHAESPQSNEPVSIKPEPKQAKKSRVEAIIDVTNDHEPELEKDIDVPL